MSSILGFNTVMMITNETLYNRQEVNGNIIVFPSSKMIKAYAYMPTLKQLVLQFKPNSHILYVYHNVSIEKFELLDKSKSVGNFIHTNIKGKHAYERIINNQIKAIV